MTLYGRFWVPPEDGMGMRAGTFRLLLRQTGNSSTKWEPQLEMISMPPSNCSASVSMILRPVDLHLLGEWFSMLSPIPVSSTASRIRPSCCRSETWISPLRPSGKACTNAFDNTSFRIRPHGIARSSSKRTGSSSKQSRTRAGSTPQELDSSGLFGGYLCLHRRRTS